ncbi:RDD family protein, partial [Streptomyces anthocyanicus]|uniref:RDD family protein n=1 Tax=Streptomyces anthocyanicus TaxID=68174 RepID=UPI003675EEFE
AGAMGAGRAHVAGTSGAARAQTPGTGAAVSGVPGSREPLVAEGTMSFRRTPQRAEQQRGTQSAAAQQPLGAAQPAAPAQPAPAAPAPQQQATPTVPPQAVSPQPATPQAATPQAATPRQAPMSAGLGGGQPSWAQQVHRLAGAGGDEQPVAPWKPPVEDVFQAAARRQAAARPAGLGKRLAARLIDTVVLGGVAAVAAVPLGIKAVDHVNDKIDEAKLSGETVTVWLLDGTTSTYLGIVLAVLLLFGVVYEALPTAKWGRTLGKKLLGLEVRDIEAHEPPAFGAALRRWLVYSVPGLLAVGVVGVLWCLFDRPWHQCWHDKAANTFVAG